MDNEYKKVAQHLVNEIGRAKELTNNVDMNEVFMSVEYIIADLAYLIKPLADLEQAFRKNVLDNMALIINEKPMSHAHAESMAKAGDEYKEWRKLDDLMELAREQIMVLKKFREDLAIEHKLT